MRCLLRLKNVFLVALVCVLVFTVPAFAVVRLDNDPPANAPFMGGYYVRGFSNTLDEVTIYLSTNEGWTVNTRGELYRYANTSASGIMIDDDSGTRYTVNCPAFSVPRYRLENSAGYQYDDLIFNPVAGNIIVENDFATPYDLQDMCAVFSCFLLGMILVVRLIKRG